MDLLKLPPSADLKPNHVVLGNDDDPNAGAVAAEVGNLLYVEL